MNELPRHGAPRSIDISYLAIVKILGAIAFVSLVKTLASFLGLMAAAILVAITLDLIAKKLESFGLRRSYAVGLIFASGVGVLAAVSFLLIPALADQMQAFGQNLPKLQQSILAQLPSGKISEMAHKAMAKPETLVANWPELLLGYGTAALSAFSSLLVAIVFAFYFLVDGRRAFEWFVTFFETPTQKKLRETGDELSLIVGEYMTAQLITSLLVALFCGGVLWALGVPGALLLAVFAGVADVVPVVGITIALAAATLTALAVSAESALWVVLAFLAYQLFENYLLTPLIYGRRLKVSNLVVLLTLAAGGILAGAIGVLLSLPLAAAYPVVERIWLKKYLGAKVVESHQALDDSANR
jgi:predicted PurR-regulated permease PerM